MLVTLLVLLVALLVLLVTLPVLVVLLVVLLVTLLVLLVTLPVRLVRLVLWTWHSRVRKRQQRARDTRDGLQRQHQTKFGWFLSCQCPLRKEVEIQQRQDPVR